METLILYILVSLIIGIIIGLIIGMVTTKKRVIKKVESFIEKENLNIDMEKLFQHKHGKVVKEDFFEIPSE